MDNLCCIVVPVYSNYLSEIERVGLIHNHSILKDYPFIAVSPEDLDISEVANTIDFNEIKRFDPGYFQSPQTYNKLLVAKHFWDSFGQFENMLILQLDALVFKDDLRKWCEKSYGYIGSPWLTGMFANRKLNLEIIKGIFNCSDDDAAAIHRFLQENGIINDLDLMQPDYWRANVELLPQPVSTVTSVDLASFLDDLEHHFHTFIGVGNGGFSLRNIPLARKLLRSESIPSCIKFSSPELSQNQHIADNLEILEETAAAMHDFNRKTVASLNRHAFSTAEALTLLNLLGEYSPQRSSAIQKIRDGILHLETTHPELQQIAGILGEMQFNMIDHYLENNAIAEDIFWGEIAPLFSDDFITAPVEDALKFGFECNPRYCYRENNRKLPFGCHGWQLAQNRDFWIEILESTNINSELTRCIKAYKDPSEDLFESMVSLVKQGKLPEAVELYRQNAHILGAFPVRERIQKIMEESSQ